MQCLNIKNKEVAALLKEYTKIFGNEDAAYYVLSENNGYGLDKAPNGEPSKLFSDLVEHYNGDRVAAIQAKARTYSKSFKEWFGDWQSEDKTNVSKVVDENGEPLLVWHGTTENFDAFSSLYRIMDGKLEFVEFKVTSDEAYLGKLIKELQVKKGYIIASIIRNRRLIVPRGDDVIEKGDSVLVCTVNKSILRLQDIFAGV